MSKRLFKKLYNIVPFYTDPDKRFNFYYRKNWLDQFDIMVHDIQNNTNRWFMVSPAIFFAFVGIEKNEQLHTYKRNIDAGVKPKLANEYINKHQYTIVSHRISKFNSDTVVAKVGEFGPEESRERVLLLKRIAAIPEQEHMVLGIDTLEIPFAGIMNFVKDVKKKYFKTIDIDLEMEDLDATN